ncbi:MAG TPA: ribonuclease P protein component [Anaerolineae bacterium]|nr:ribonuclease P protein component [Anaerolineae bacterium]
MKRKNRLTRTKDFIRVTQVGKSLIHPLLVLVIAKNSLSVTRIAVVASKSIGNAVKRNKAKRRLRALINEVLSSIKVGWDLIFFARIRMNDSSYQDLQCAIDRLLEQADLKVSN